MIDMAFAEICMVPNLPVSITSYCVMPIAGIIKGKSARIEVAPCKLTLTVQSQINWGPLFLAIPDADFEVSIGVRHGGSLDKR
jgi:hypothetical protein